MSLSKSNRVPIYVQVAEELESTMLRGEYGVGDRLPTEHALAEEYGINRHTAGQALNQLQVKGLVVRVRGRGTFVRPGRVDYRVARKMSFSDSVLRAGLKPAKKVLGIHRIRSYGRIPGKMGIPAGDPLVALERVSFAGEIPLDYSVKHFREAIFPGMYELLGGRWNSVYALIETNYGIDLRRARSTFEIEPADGDIARHLGVLQGSPLLKVESLDTLEDGTPAEWGVTHFRGDATRIQVDLTEAKGDDHHSAT